MMEISQRRKRSHPLVCAADELEKTIDCEGMSAAPSREWKEVRTAVTTIQGGEGRKRMAAAGLEEEALSNDMQFL
ncbi:hypothetical protein CDL15_Pgr009104 [Punica granatum]|uniref:Uncharacterized protein n=1 Tax=Punica granatum TaxID=22663 RepID=A0A218VY89_PUNGR|nr:hypothetical protein CDL15_Pgr009104 [Punica granatum]